jgi:tetratricopeptide (TPR) repeat protein
LKQQPKQARWIAAAGLWVLAPLCLAGCAATDSGKAGDGFQTLNGTVNAPKQSWTDKLAAPFRGSGDITDNRTATANDGDALSLSKKPNKKNPDLIVAMAQMHERAGLVDDAEKEYQRALRLAPKHLGALIGYAHLQDRRNKLEEASELYQRAVAAHPKEAAAYNDLGLCYHRQGKLSEAQATLSKAIELAPDRKLYRNNLAGVMVERGQFDVALSQLSAAHGAAAGHYNLGYLLAKKGETQRAIGHFQQAATLDPSLTAAQQWVAKLSAPANGPMLTANQGIAATVESTSSLPSANNSVSYTGPRYPQFSASATTDENLGVPPQPAEVSAAGYRPPGNGWASPPAAVRYPAGSTSNYSGTASLPPTPEQMRQ